MSLKRDLACPHCECRQVWHIAEMHERGEAAPFEKPIAPINVVLQQKFFKLYSGTGRFETYICKRCGFTEWYAHGLDELKPDEANGVFLIDGEEVDRNRGPYR
jgi:predicted nucleic-acid-binding Zn-ribbon protein